MRLDGFSSYVSGRDRPNLVKNDCKQKYPDVRTTEIVLDSRQGEGSAVLVRCASSMEAMLGTQFCASFVDDCYCYSVIRGRESVAKLLLYSQNTISEGAQT